MRDAFKRSEKFLDLEINQEDPILRQKEQMKETIQNATPEDLGQVLEVFQKMNIGKTMQAKGYLQAREQSSSSWRVGSS